MQNPIPRSYEAPPMVHGPSHMLPNHGFRGGVKYDFPIESHSIPISSLSMDCSMPLWKHYGGSVAPPVIADRETIIAQHIALDCLEVQDPESWKMFEWNSTKDQPQEEKGRKKGISPVGVLGNITPKHSEALLGGEWPLGWGVTFFFGNLKHSQSGTVLKTWDMDCCHRTRDSPSHDFINPSWIDDKLSPNMGYA